MFRLTSDKLSVVFADVDGTLYNIDKGATLETIYDINFLKDNNGHFNLCTGNPYLERMAKLCNDLKVNYIIASSGAHIYDVAAQKTLFKALIKFKDYAYIIDLILKNDFQMVFWDEEEYYLLKKNHVWNEEILYYHFLVEKTKKEKVLYYSGKPKDVLKIEIYADNKDYNSESLNAFYKKIKDDKNLDITLTSINIEIQAKNINKGSGVSWMLNNVYKNYGLVANDIMTIGDSNNDISMLKLTEYSYAMANANQNVKANAKYHTSAVEQNGLGEAILDYLYRSKNLARKYMFHEFEDKGGHNE